MTLRDYTANVISATKVVPDGNFKNKASGVWDINEALDLIKGGNWPNAANFNPASFVDGLFQTTLWTGMIHLHKLLPLILILVIRVGFFGLSKEMVLMNITGY